MGAIEAVAMIGTSFVLISLYRAISCAEKRYQALWHGRGVGRRRRAGFQSWRQRRFQISPPCQHTAARRPRRQIANNGATHAKKG